MPIASWSKTQSPTAKPISKPTSKGVIQKWGAPTQQEQHAADVAHAKAQSEQIDANLNKKPSIGSMLKSAFGLLSPTNIKSTYQNIVKPDIKNDPVGVLTAIPRGLFDAGSVILNNVARPVVNAEDYIGNKVFGNKQKTPNLPVFSDELDKTGAYEGASKYGQLPAPESDTANALRKSATQVAGYEIGGAATKGLGLSRIPGTIVGNIVGGQATTDAKTLKQRAKQAATDAIFGAVTEGAGLGLKKVLTKSPSLPAETTITTPEALKLPQEAPITSKAVETTPPNKTTSSAPKIETTTISKPSKAASDINRKLAEKGLAEIPEDQLTHFTPIQKANQTEKVAQILTNDLEGAKVMAKGHAPIPEDVHPQVLFNSVKKKAIADGDFETLRELASSPIAGQRSEAAQTLSAAGFDNGNSDPVEAMRKIQKTREEALTRKGVDIKKASSKIRNEISNEIKQARPKPNDWSSFVESIKCK